jgi:hypothetical protein
MNNAIFRDIKTQVVPHRKNMKASLQIPDGSCYLRFDISTVVTMKNAVFWDVTPCGCCRNRRFGGTYCFHHQGKGNQQPKHAAKK